MFRCQVVSSSQETFIDPSKKERHIFSAVLKQGQATSLTFKYAQKVGETEKLEKILLEFPSHCVIGERRLFLEIYFPKNVSTLRGKETLLTPVVFISQATHVPFLRKVTVKLPFDQRVVNISSDVETANLSFKKELFVREDHFEIKSFSFSPVGVTGSVAVNEVDHVSKELLQSFQ